MHFWFPSTLPKALLIIHQVVWNFQNVANFHSGCQTWHFILVHRHAWLFLPPLTLQQHFACSLSLLLAILNLRCGIQFRAGAWKRNWADGFRMHPGNLPCLQVFVWGRIWSYFRLVPPSGKALILFFSQVVAYDDSGQRGRIQVLTEQMKNGRGETRSHLVIRNVSPLTDSGNYTCKPSIARAASIKVHVLESKCNIHVVTLA